MAPRRERDDEGFVVTEAVVPVSIVAWFASGVASLLALLMSIIWRKHNAEIQELKDGLSKTVKAETYEQNRRETMQAVNHLHEKIENIDQRAQDRHNEVMGVLLDFKK